MLHTRRPLGKLRLGPRQKLLLQAAFGSDREQAVSALNEWWGTIRDFDEVRGTDARLFPQIYWNIGTDGIVDQVLAAR